MQQHGSKCVFYVLVQSGGWCGTVGAYFASQPSRDEGARQRGAEVKLKEGAALPAVAASQLLRAIREAFLGLNRPSCGVNCTGLVGWRYLGYSSS